MKKVVCALFLCALIFSGAKARADAAFLLDDAHTYAHMERPYRQGYAPTVSGNAAHVVLPLLSEICSGQITAELVPENLNASPIRLDNQLVKVVERGVYSFSGEKVSAYNVYFKLSLYPSRLNGEYPCSIIVHGKDVGGHALRQTFPITLRIGDGQLNDAAPDVGIDAFEVGEALYVGESGLFKITVSNRSHTREARDITLTMTDPTGDILPQGSNVRSVGTLGAGERTVIEIPVRSLAKGSAQPHAIEFLLSYGYADGKTAERSEKFTVELQQEVRLNHTEAVLPQRVAQGDNVAFNLSLMNMGKGTLYNALLTFDVPNIAAGASVLVGTIEPGKSAVAIANLRVDEKFTGETNGTLTITCEDGYGVPHEKTLPLSTVIIEKAVPVGVGVGTSAANADSTTGIKPSIRELCAWALAGLFLAMFITKAILSAKKIRRLEEKQL